CSAISTGLCAPYCYRSPRRAALRNTLPAHMRSSPLAVNVPVIHMHGDAISPFLMGAISDATGSLVYGLLLAALMIAVGGAILVASAPVLRRALTPPEPTPSRMP